jgi:hypothetical protein
MDIDPAMIAPDVPRYIALLETVPWFANLGKPHPRDAEVVRIHSWAEWPGPEGGHGYWFGRWPAFVQETIEAAEPARRAELKEVWDRVYALVLNRAARNVPGFDPAQDAWHGPTACVHDAAYIAALVAWHIHLGRPIPRIIAEEWLWYADGQWPCDFAEEPVGLDESLENVPEVRFLVY